MSEGLHGQFCLLYLPFDGISSVESDDQWALVLFEDEDKYSVVEKDRIKEDHYAYNQTVNVLWGKGRHAQYYPAKLVICGNAPLLKIICVVPCRHLYCHPAHFRCTVPEILLVYSIIAGSMRKLN